MEIPCVHTTKNPRPDLAPNTAGRLPLRACRKAARVSQEKVTDYGSVPSTAT